MTAECLKLHWTVNLFVLAAEEIKVIGIVGLSESDVYYQ